MALVGVGGAVSTSPTFFAEADPELLLLCDAHTLPQTVMSLAARGRARSVDSFRTTIVEKGYFSLCLCRLDSERPSHMYPVDHDQQPTPTLSDAFIPQIPNHSESQDFRKRMPRHNKQLKQ